MSEMKYTITGSWPGIKDGLRNFLSDTDGWAMNELQNARDDKNWEAVNAVLEIMEMLHGISHDH